MSFAVRAGLVLAVATIAPSASAQPRDPDWSRQLPDLLPAIEACRAQAAPGSVVLSAWPMNHGLGGSRWRSPSGEARDCLADLTGARVDSWWPARDDGKGDGDPIFVPTGRWGVTNRACVRVEPVERAGEIVGFLYSGTCR